MPNEPGRPTRRGFLKSAAQAGAALAVPCVVPGSALGRDGAVAPGDRITPGGLGLGGRGTGDLGCFLRNPDVQFLAICDVRRHRREANRMRSRAMRQPWRI